MNKILVFILLLLFGYNQVFSQDIITIDAFVLDKSTNQPIPYVNIGFVDKSIGTASNEKGSFKLQYEEDYIRNFDVLQFSSLGYKTLKIKAPDLFSKLSNTNKIYLQPDIQSLDELIITAPETEKKQVGGLDFDGYTIGYWKEEVALGGEIATRLKINKKDSKLLDLKLRILENISDSIKLRVNIYDSNKKLPNKNLLSTNIFHVVTKKIGIDTINLKPYNIKVDNDIIVSIELVEVFGDKVGFVVAGIGSGTTFTRYISQDKWEEIKDATMSFQVLTSFPKKYNKIEKRTKPNTITILWDNSESMFLNRNINKEFEFLKTYLNTIKNVKVRVVKFNMEITSDKTFEVKKGESELLLNHLKNTTYEAGTSFTDVFSKNSFNSDIVMLFGDGYSTLSDFEYNFRNPIFCISSNYKTNHKVLQEISQSSDASYVNLNKTSISSALRYMEFDILDKTVYDEASVLDNRNTIYGVVQSKSGPLEGVSVSIKNTYDEVFTDEEGKYEIKADYGDILLVNYFGVKQKAITVSNKKNIDIDLELNIEFLEEISVSGINEKSNDNDNIARLGNRKLGYASNYISENDIRPSDIYFVDVLRRTPGVNVSGTPINANIWIRDKRTPPAVFVDGLYSLNYLNLSPQNIKSITVLRSLAGINRFGSDAAGGAILVTTKTSEFSSEEQLKNWALLTGNDYDQTKFYPETNSKVSNFVNELYAASSFNEALQIYEAQKTRFEQLPIFFYFDASEYFERWDSTKAYNILTSIADIAYNNVKALKTLAYKLEALNKYEEARFIYKRILELNPKQAQSYRDMALAYQNTGNYNKAMLLYKQMLLGTIPEVDFSGLRSVIENELRHLVMLHKAEVDYNDLSPDLLSLNFKKDMRFVFEWNNPLAEFELQFVNPDNKYFTWELSEFSKKERILDGIQKGYQTEEFFIDDAEPGKWLINIKNLKGEETQNPTYLKYTVYKNFAKPNETKSVRVIKLFELQSKATLDEFVYN
ncbi:hypothetical protein E1J38_003765 [Seonamhaeicola sediminis]|uniref:TonB-dependent receptor plug domain-containing protein n=1 Tax=Seonamhaeicola sediminis TaxID=2528206 RepID=A0A562YGK7_9FLAO|nr:carboxypeptidase-like regulatory domain-containing protein [Seonamhaeicola sediminis]TWO33901.1 hypothetical protein E1J38_003765 [Seonamhaeicola sediminis]